MTGFVGLLKIELPAHTIRLTDGGFITFDSEQYTSNDSVVGTLGAIEPREEGIGGDIPTLDLSFNPPSALAISTLTTGTLQRSTLRLWLAEYNPDTNAIVGTPDLQFIGQLDQPSIRFAKGEYSISMSAVSKAEWFFERDVGNGLSSSFHKSLYPGETGHDNASGLSIPVAWGVEGPPSSGGAAGGSRSATNVGTQSRQYAR